MPLCLWGLSISVASLCASSFRMAGWRVRKFVKTINKTHLISFIDDLINVFFTLPLQLGSIVLIQGLIQCQHVAVVTVESMYHWRHYWIGLLVTSILSQGSCELPFDHSLGTVPVDLMPSNGIANHLESKPSYRLKPRMEAIHFVLFSSTLFADKHNAIRLNNISIDSWYMAKPYTLCAPIPKHLHRFVERSARSACIASWTPGTPGCLVTVDTLKYTIVDNYLIITHSLVLHIKTSKHSSAAFATFSANRCRCIEKSPHITCLTLLHRLDKIVVLTRMSGQVSQGEHEQTRLCNARATLTMFPSDIPWMILNWAANDIVTAQQIDWHCFTRDAITVTVSR